MADSQDFQLFGQQLRSLLQGLLSGAAVQPSVAGTPPPPPVTKMAWGRLVDTKGLPELFAGDGAPKKHTRKVHPPAGVDHMKLKTRDVFRIPGMGEFEVPFNGFFKVARSEPDTQDWETATVYVNFNELKLFGEHEELGNITVDLNPDVVSAGNTFPARDVGASLGNVACRINVAARFHIDKLGTTLFNKTPIQLKNDDVQGIPTIGEGGHAYVGSLPLYRTDAPNGELFGYVEELEYTVLNYATREEVDLFRKAGTATELKALMAK